MKKLLILCCLFSFTILSSQSPEYRHEHLDNDYWYQGFKVKKSIFEEKSDFQDLCIYENELFGKVLEIDHIIQTCQRDEFVYHEMITHVPLTMHAKPQNVLVIGGGDGGVLREALKHPQVEHATLVEIDRKVINLCQKYLPELSQGSLDDPRVDVVIADGCEFVKSHQGQFDVIIIDSTDPVGPGEVLFTSEFYSDCKGALKENGLLVCQNGCTFTQMPELINCHKNRLDNFSNSTCYLAPVPTYIGGFMAFGISSKSDELPAVDQKSLKERISNLSGELKYYNSDIHQACFALPNYVSRSLETLKDHS